MMLRTCDRNYSFEFSERMGSGGMHKYVTPRNYIRNDVQSAGSSQRKIKISTKKYHPIRTKSPSSSPKFTKKSNGNSFQSVSSIKHSQSCRSIDERTELDLTHFIKSASPSASSIKEFENLVYAESHRTCDGVLPLFLTRLLLGFTKIKRSLFLNMLNELKRQKRESNILPPSPTIKAIRENWEGEFGLTLFCPFGQDSFPQTSQKNLPNPKYKSIRSESSTTTFSSLFDSDDSVNCSDEDEDEDEDDISIMHEENLVQNPRILSREQMKELQDHMPASVQLMAWSRSYSLLRDGCNFDTMMHKCRAYNNTLVVIRTVEGDILGGFVDKPWFKQSGNGVLQRSRSFYGTGKCFLFASNPESQSKTDGLQVYKWTGENSYSQICDAEVGTLAMGGGGEFGWIIEDNFSRGSTGRSSTFNNPPLLNGVPGGTFEVLDIEIYGFKTMSELFMSGSYASLSSLAS